MLKSISSPKTVADYKISVVLSCLLLIVAGSNGITPKGSRVKTQDNPYVTLFADSLHRGKQHVEFIRGGCKNLPESVENWASSINTHNRCVDVCDQKDCDGKCVRIYPASGVTVDMGLKLELVGMNDRISSLKSCYTFVSKPKRG